MSKRTIISMHSDLGVGCQQKLNVCNVHMCMYAWIYVCGSNIDCICVCAYRPSYSNYHDLIRSNRSNAKDR